MGKPLSRPGCFQKNSCCRVKHGVGEGGGVRGGGGSIVEGGYGDGYVPQRSIYDTMCLNQQIDSQHHHHHHHMGGSMREGGAGVEGAFNYSASSSLRVSRSPGDMFDQQPRSLTPNPSFVRRLDERAIYDSLKLGVQEADGVDCHSPGCFKRSASPSVSSFSAPGISSSSKKHHQQQQQHQHHPHHHHGNSGKNRDGRHSWKVVTPPDHLDCLELSTEDMLERGGGYLNPGAYPPVGSSSLTSPLISPFSGSPHSSGYHTPHFFSPAKPRPQTQSLRCSPPHVTQPRHYSQTQSLRLSPTHELSRSPYRAPLVQLSARDLQEDMRERAWAGRTDREREREWEREREREMERGWAEREWEKERERGRLERERARERERRDTSVSSFGTFGYGRAAPLCSDRDSVFLEPDQVHDTMPLLPPQPSLSPSPKAAPRMGTGAVGRNRAGSKVGPETMSGSVRLCNSGGGGRPWLGCESHPGSMAETQFTPEAQFDNSSESWSESHNRVDDGIENTKPRIESKGKTGPERSLSESIKLSGIKTENSSSSANKEKHRGQSMAGNRAERVQAKCEPSAEARTSAAEQVENKIEAEFIEDIGIKSDARTKRGTKSVIVDVKRTQQVDTLQHTSGLVDEEVCTVHETVSAKADAIVEPKVETTPKTEHSSQSGFDTISGSTTEKTNPDLNSARHRDGRETITVDGGNPELLPYETADKKVDMGKIGLIAPKPDFGGQKLSVSKPNSRTRPGTATGLRPGLVSPKLGSGLGEQDPAATPDGMESTWPRRVIVRKRTVLQGGALHNLPILPPLPSVLSALEKRFPYHLPGLAHHSENPLSNLALIGAVGRCSLKEPSHLDLGLCASVVSRASLKEQNLEQWRTKEHNDLRIQRRNNENQEESTAQKEEKKVNTIEHDKLKPKEMMGGNHGDRPGKHEKCEKKCVESYGVGKVEDVITKQVESRGIAQVEIQESVTQERKIKDMFALEVKVNKVDERTSKVVPSQEEPKPKEEEVGGKVRIDLEGEWMEGRDISEEAGEVESWDVVLEMVNTIWEDGWAGGRGAGAVEEGDTGSISGSLQRWPLLRPPAGFGGSHPPSSAASELSLTELEKRARELDSDLEHLDLSQPHREAHELILPKPQKGRTDMYQTHPGPQREKCALFTGVGSRYQVRLELSPAIIEKVNTDIDTSWSAKSAAGAPTIGTSSTKEDSSPDSNLTLESDSSGVFLSLSNQSQDEVGSDSDQPMSGSDLGSSSTSFDRDGEEAGVNEWGREESAELDWCYPSLLDPSSHEHIGGDGSEGEEGSENENKDRRATEKEAVSIKTSVQMFSSVSLPTSPFQQPVKQFLNPNLPMRSSGLDCGDLDPFVQSDSFVYLAVSTSPSTQADTAEAIDMSPHEAIPVISNKHFSVPQAHVDLSPAQKDVVTVTHLVPQRPEEGDFLSTDSFVYLAAPACLLLGPEGTAPYGTRDSDSDSSGSGAVDVSVLGCGSLAGDSDWDSDVSDSDPHRSSSRVPGGSGRPQSGPAHPKRPPTTEPGWDLFGDVTEPEVLSELFEEDDSSSNNLNNNVTMVTVVATSMVKTTPGVVRGVTPEPVDEMTKAVTTVEQPSTAKKVTWQFKPAQRSVCTGSRKEKESSTSLSLRYADQGAGEAHCPLPSSPSSSSSSSSSPSSSSSG